MTVRGKRCPKCEEGSLLDGPTYYFSYPDDERLEFRCTRCGYSESDPTKDHDAKTAKE